MKFELLTELKVYSDTIDAINKKIRKFYQSLLLQLITIIIATYLVYYIERIIIVNSAYIDELIMRMISIIIVPLIYIGIVKEVYIDMKGNKQTNDQHSMIAESSFTKILIILCNLPQNPGFHITERNHQPITTFPKGKIYWEVVNTNKPINSTHRRKHRGKRRCSRTCTDFIDDFLNELNII